MSINAILVITMPKWDKEETSFSVKISYAKRGSKRYGRVVVPKPVLRLLGFPEEVSFDVKNGEIKIRPEVS